MKSKLLSLSAASLALLVIGCNQAPTTAAKTPEPAKDAGATPKAAPTLSSVPEELKTDGFQYYGLGSTKTLTYAMKTEGSSRTGTQSVTMKEMLDGTTPIMTVSRDGALLDMGKEEIAVKKDGIYMVSGSFGPVSPEMMVLPAKLDLGTTWTVKSTMKSEPSREIEMSSTFTVTAKEKVKVEAGEFEAIKVVAKGTIKQKIDEGGGKIREVTTPLNADAWYSKEIGTVKLSATTTTKDGKPQTSVVELAKTE